ncbi:MAG: sodium:solute symporter family protein [bacterium]|nr:sodium:solute symporter family protein [bacterium]
MTGIHWGGLACMGAFYALIFFVGIWFPKRRDTGAPADLLLAGRNIPLWIALLTMTATWVCGGYVNGTAENVYRNGMTWGAQAGLCYAASLILGGLFFARTMRRMGFTTLIDPFERRFGRGVAGALFFPALAGEVFWSAAILTALGTTFGTILNIDLSTAIVISAAVAVGYTAVGGLWSVAYTDVLQLAFILAGLLAAIPFAAARAGGFAAVAAQFRDAGGSLTSFLPPLRDVAAHPPWTVPLVLNWWDWTFLLMLGGIPWNVYFQRVLAARNERVAARFSIWAGLLCALMAVPPIVIGVIGSVVPWRELGLDVEYPAMILPYVLRYCTPYWVGMLGLGAVAAAVMSSVDSSVLSASSMFTWNWYRGIIRPRAGDRSLRVCLRLCTVAVGVAATVIALRVRSVQALWYLCSDAVYVILFPQLVAALFMRRANTPGAVAGIAVSASLRFGGGDPLLGIPRLIPYPWWEPETGTLFPFKTLAMLCGLAAIVVVSRLTARRFPPRPLGSAAA